VGAEYADILCSIIISYLIRVLDVLCKDKIILFRESYVSYGVDYELVYGNINIPTIFRKTNI